MPAPTGQVSRLTVEQATTEEQWRAGLELCDSVYQEAYGAHWIDKPDVLFIASDEEGPVATVGLELARLRQRIDSERYFRLSPRMRAFIAENKDRIAEFGRFSCEPRAAVSGSGAVMHAMLSYCADHGIDYLFAWARPAVARHGARQGIPFWNLDVPLDEATIRNCTAWSSPPVRFFFGKETPRLMLAVVPFFELVIDNLATALSEMGRARTEE